MEIMEPKATHHFEDVIKGKNVACAVKHYHEVAYLYETKREDDPIVYEVYTYGEGNDKKGNLNWGLTVLKPVLSNGECNMTKGHFHVWKEAAEYYLGVSGEGLLLLMDEEGHTWGEKVYEGSLHHVDGHYAHRLVNTGNVDLKVAACWPTSAGHDYEAIEKREFGYRIFKTENGIECRKRSK